MSTCEGINGGAVYKVDTERLLIGLFTSCAGLSNSFASFITNSFITDSVTSLTWAEVTIIDQFSIGSRADHSESSSPSSIPPWAKCLRHEHVLSVLLSILTLGGGGCGWPQSARPRINRETRWLSVSYNG